VISPEGENLGEMTREEGLKKAQEQGLDLVVVNQKADPPVAKILELKKFIYEKKKQKQQSLRGKKKKTQELKQLRFKPNIGPHDLEIRLKRAREFLEDGNKIKFIVQFLGRQITHKKVGEAKINQILSALEDIAEVEKEPWFEGKRLMVIVRPK